MMQTELCMHLGNCSGQNGAVPPWEKETATADGPVAMTPWPCSRVYVFSELDNQICEWIYALRSSANNVLLRMADHTGQPLKKVAEDTDRDYFLAPSEAVAYGLIDRVVNNSGDGLRVADMT